MRLVCVLVLVLGGFQLTCALIRVAAWNVQTFGPSKANLLNPTQDKAATLKLIATVVRRYDLVVIQEVRGREVRGRDLTAITPLMSLLNPITRPRPMRLKKTIPHPTHFKPVSSSVYDHRESEPLPTGQQYQERYVYIYKTSTVKFLGDYQYPESNNRFVRPPFAAQFKAVAESFDFVMIPLHAKPGPGVTVREINALADVVNTLPHAWNTQNILLLGDFNAGGTYLSAADRARLTLPANCQWLIKDDAVTTVMTDHPYDRIVATDYMIQHHVVDDTAKPYDFKTELGLSQNQAKKVSDHFPVEVQLKKKV